MKDSWPAPMATSEMPRGEFQLDSPFLRSCRKVPRIAGPLLAASLKRPGPVKSVSVIAPRRRRLISCPETKIAAESQERGNERERERKRENEGTEGKFGERNQDVHLSSLLVASYRGERYTLYWSREREQSLRTCNRMSVCRP